MEREEKESIAKLLYARIHHAWSYGKEARQEDLRRLDQLAFELWGI